MHKKDDVRRPTELVDVPTAAQRLHVSRRFVWKMLTCRRLTPIRLGRRATRIDAAEIERLIEVASIRSAK